MWSYGGNVPGAGSSRTLPELLTIKKPDRGIRLCCYGVRFPKVFDLGLLRIFRFTQLAKKGFIKWLADIHAGSDELVED
jgi:hypothetical protein